MNSAVFVLIAATVAVQFIDVHGASHYPKKERTWCSPVHGHYNTLVEAQSACQIDDNCIGIDNFRCSPSAEFNLCDKDSKFKSSSSGNCVYKKPECTNDVDCGSGRTCRNGKCVGDKPWCKRVVSARPSRCSSFYYKERCPQTCGTNDIGCVNQRFPDATCDAWANIGLCQRNVNFMNTYCKKSCPPCGEGRKCYCAHQNGASPKNGIMCGRSGKFSLNSYCHYREVCTGTTNQTNAIDESNKKALCTKECEPYSEKACRDLTLNSPRLTFYGISYREKGCFAYYSGAVLYGRGGTLDEKKGSVSSPKYRPVGHDCKQAETSINELVGLWRVEGRHGARKERNGSMEFACKRISDIGLRCTNFYFVIKFDGATLSTPSSTGNYNNGVITWEDGRITGWKWTKQEPCTTSTDCDDGEFCQQDGTCTLLGTCVGVSSWHNTYCASNFPMSSKCDGNLYCKWKRPCSSNSDCPSDKPFCTNGTCYGDYKKASVGSLCADKAFELTEEECKRAVTDLGLFWAGSWNGPNDFPACLYTADGRNKVFFNRSPNPSRTNVNPKYAAICKTKGA